MQRAVAQLEKWMRKWTWNLWCLKKRTLKRRSGGREKSQCASMWKTQDSNKMIELETHVLSFHKVFCHNVQCTCLHMFGSKMLMRVDSHHESSLANKIGNWKQFVNKAKWEQNVDLNWSLWVSHLWQICVCFNSETLKWETSFLKVFSSLWQLHTQQCNASLRHLNCELCKKNSKKCELLPPNPTPEIIP